MQQCAAGSHCNSNPPTRGSQGGLCSKLVEECGSQVVVGVQFSSSRFIDWANFQRDPDICFFK